MVWRIKFLSTSQLVPAGKLAMGVPHAEPLGFGVPAVISDGIPDREKNQTLMPVLSRSVA